MNSKVREEHLWQNVFRDAGIAIALLDMEGRLLRANAALIEMLGYGEDELRSMSVADLSHPEDMAADQAAFDRLLSGGESRYQIEKRYIRKDGALVWGLLTVSLVRDDDGRPTHIVGMIENIDARKRAEAAQREAEWRLLAILDSLPAYVAEIGRDGRYLFVNRAYEETFKRGRAEIEGRPVHEILAEADHEALASRIAAALDGVPVTYEDRIRLGDKGPRHLRVSYLPHRAEDGRVSSFFVFGQDDTERHVAEREREEVLRRLEEKTRMLDAVLSAAAESISLFGRDGRYLYASRRAARGLGVDQAAIIGRRFHELGVPPVIADQIERHRLQVMETGSSVTAEIDVPTVAGPRAYEYTLNPVRDAGGAVVAVVAVAHDMTDRKQVEDSIRRSLTEKEVLLREIHHRVKNNMQVIVSLLNLQSQGFTQPELRHSHEELGNRIRALALVHQMLTEGPTLERIDLSDYVARLVEQLRRFHLGDGRRIEVRLKLEPVSIDMDRAVPLGLIVNEMVSNCFVHAFPDDRRGVATVALAERDGVVELSVTDNGIGFAGPDPDGTSLGTRLIKVLSNQIAGTVRYEVLEPGTRAVVRWPATPG